MTSLHHMGCVFRGAESAAGGWAPDPCSARGSGAQTPSVVTDLSPRTQIRLTFLHPDLRPGSPRPSAGDSGTLPAPVRVIPDIDVPLLFDECVRCRVRAGSKSGRCLGMFPHAAHSPLQAPPSHQLIASVATRTEVRVPDRDTVRAEQTTDGREFPKSDKETVRALGAGGNKNGLTGPVFVLFV